jgi:hypothetical protein
VFQQAGRVDGRPYLRADRVMLDAHGVISPDSAPDAKARIS